MIVLTGGAGFIGSAVLAGLNRAGLHDIIVVDNLGTSDKWKNLLGKRFKEYWPRELLRQKLESKNVPDGIQAIIHLGACSSTTEQNVNYLIENNVQFSALLARYAAERDIRFVYASSAATYGNGDDGFSDRSELRTLKPLNAYGFSKYLFDLWLEEHQLLDRSCGLKFFNVYGPNEGHKGSMRSMVQKAYEQVRDQGSIKLFRSNSPDFKNGEQKRDFIYVKDCIDVVLWLLERRSINGVFNLGQGIANSWNELASAVFAAMKKPTQIEFIDMPEALRKQYQNYTCAPMEKLKKAGYSGKFTSLEEGVTDYIANYLLPEQRL